MVRRRTGLERDSHLSSDPREEGSGPRVAHSNLALWCPGSISIEVAQKSFLSVEEKPRLLPLGHKGTPSLRGTTLSLPRWQTVMLEMSSEDLSSENDPSKSPGHLQTPTFSSHNAHTPNISSFLSTLKRLAHSTLTQS